MQYILVDHPTLGLECILKQITHMGISIMLKLKGRAIYQNALHLPKP